MFIENFFFTFCKIIKSKSLISSYDVKFDSNQNVNGLFFDAFKDLENSKTHSNDVILILKL